MTILRRTEMITEEYLKEHFLTAILLTMKDKTLRY